MRLIYIIATACILLAVAGLKAQNQLLLMQKHTQPSGSTLLLDDYGNANAAYSLRKLSSSYNGDAIRVRRASDDATANIGFDVNGDLDQSALTTFVSNGNTDEVFINSTISSNTGFILAGSTTYNTSTEAFDVLGSSGLTVRQDKSVEGVEYRVKVEVSNCNSCGFTIYAGGNQTSLINTDGTHEVTIVGGSSNSIFAVNPNQPSGSSFSINSFSAIAQTFSSDFSSSDVNGAVTSQVSITSNIDGIGGLDDNLEVTVNTATSSHFVYFPIYDIGSRYDLELQVYLPSTNVNVDKISIYPSSTGVTPVTVTTTDQWVTVTSLDFVASTDNRLNIFMSEGNLLDFTGNGTDKIYVRGIKVDNLGDTNADGFITTWYDQSGNSLDATQTTNTKQPKIVSSGVVELENSKPTIVFDGSDDELAVGTVSSFNYLHDGTSSSVITVAKYAGSGNIALFGNNKGGAFEVGFSLFYTPLNRIENYITKGSVDYTLNQSPQTTDILSQHLVFMAIDSDNSTASNRSVISINNQADFSTNTNLASPSTNDAGTIMTIANAGVTGSSNFGGNIQEIIFYNTDKTSSKADILNNINTYYSIY